MTKLAELLNKRFLEWQNGKGKPQSWKDFAVYLGAKPTTLSTWLNTDIRPNPVIIPVLAEKLGIEVYDALDLPRPNPVVQRVQLAIQNIPPEDLEALSKDMEAWIRDWAAKRGSGVK